ncbi:MAG: hypothetical protein GX114_02365, partial [Clostridiales bacterium]|nr:hypothetical protein [Clostridiales bacterium]
MAGKKTLIAAVIIMIWALVPAWTKAGPPETIRVGLRFDTTAPSSVRISSDG